MNTLNEVCQKHGFDVAMIRSRTRKREVVSLRQRVVYELCKMQMTQTEIAELINRNQSSISRLLTNYSN